jgi:riboflavin transporter
MLNQSKRQRLQWLSLVGILSALTYVLYLIRIPVILFLEINFSEVVMFIGGFSLGPLATIFMGVFRFLFAIPFTTTGAIGEFADFIYSMAFILPGAFLYQKRRNKDIALLGFALGMVFQLLITSFANALLITDLYLSLFLNITPAEFLGYVQTALPQVTNPYWSLVFWMYLPFNMFKNTTIIVFTLLTYKRVHQLINKTKSTI